MRKLFLLLIISLLTLPLFAQHSAQYVMTSEGYFVRGQVKKGVGYVTLRTFLRDGNERVDSVVMDKKGKFVFWGHTEEPVPALLTINGMKSYRLYLEPAMNMEIEINIKKGFPKIKNAKWTSDWYDIVNADGIEDYAVYEERLENWAVNHPNHIFSADIMATYLAHYWDYDQLRKHLNVLKGDATRCYHYKHLRERELDLQKIALGKKTPEIAMKDSGRKNVSLNKFISSKKYVLINFWASWSEKSKEIIPNLRLIYNQYKNKGFDIYGVSLDKDAGEFNSFLKMEPMPWVNVSDYKQWESQAVKDYMIKSLPDNVLVDGKGNIVARNLSTEELQQTLASLLDYKGYEITGNIEGIKEGVVKLELLLENGKRQTSSARINNGNWKFTGTVDKVCMGMITLPMKDGTISFFMENDKISITGKKKDLEHVAIKGSASQDKFMSIANNCNRQKNPMQCLSDYVRNNPSSIYAPFIISNYLYPYMSDEDRQTAVNSLKGKATTMFQYHLLVQQAKEEAEGKDMLSEKAKDFTLKDINGKDVTLYQSIMFYDYTLVTFWASWDNASRNRNLDYLRLYNNIKKANNFNIIAVSLDDSKIQWENAVKQDGMGKWDNVSDLKRWSSSVVRLYDLKNIPSNMLLDKNGNIIGRNVTLEEIIRIVTNR